MAIERVIENNRTANPDFGKVSHAAATTTWCVDPEIGKRIKHRNLLKSITVLSIPTFVKADGASKRIQGLTR